MLLIGIAVTFYIVSNRSKLPQNIVWIGHSLNILALLAIAANAVGWPVSPNPSVYLASVWLVLGIASVNFLDLVFRRVLGQTGT